MRKVLLLVLVSILCVSMAYSDASETFQMPAMEEILQVTVGVTTVMYVAITELAYVMGDDIPGMTGTLDYTGANTAISWENCDLGPLFADGPADAGTLFIEKGTHTTSIQHDLLVNRMDVSITYAQGDEMDGTYHVVYETHTEDQGDGEEQIIAFLVNGKDIQKSMDLMENL